MTEIKFEIKEKTVEITDSDDDSIELSKEDFKKIYEELQ